MSDASLVAVSGPQIRAYLERWCTAMVDSADALNALDARLGDGDLGTTLQQCAHLMKAALDGAPIQNPSELFKLSAMACAKGSGSSFGTLLAQALMVATKAAQGKADLSIADMASLLDDVLARLMARGGAHLGDKTMLDSIQAIQTALSSADGSANLKDVVVSASLSALDTMRDQPNKIGRARMFGEQTVGKDDPGMIAVHRMVEAI